MGKKSQIALIDLLISFGVASSLIIIIVIGWNFYNETLAARQKEELLELTAMQALELLVKSPGEPSSWENDIPSTDILGLATSDRNISLKKVHALNLTSYNMTSKLLGTGAIDFQLSIVHSNGTRLFTYGINKSSSTPIITLRRIVLFQNIPTFIEIAAWE